MKQNKEALKKHFETGDKPTQLQYTDLIDSYVDNKQPVGEANRRFVIDAQGEVNLASEQQVLEYTLSPISGTNTVDLLKDGVSVSQIDLTTYIDDTNLARLISGTVDVNGMATFTRDDNTTFTVDLSNLKDAVPQYQAGTNITIDSTNPLEPVINARNEGLRFEASAGNGLTKTNFKTTSIIPKNSVFSAETQVVDGEPVILFPRLNYYFPTGIFFSCRVQGHGPRRPRDGTGLFFLIP